MRSRVATAAVLRRHLPALIDAVAFAIQAAIDTLTTPIEAAIDALATTIQAPIYPIARAIEAVSSLVPTSPLCPRSTPIEAVINTIAFAIETTLDAITLTVEALFDPIALAVKVVVNAIPRVRNRQTRGAQSRYTNSGGDNSVQHFPILFTLCSFCNVAAAQKVDTTSGMAGHICGRARLEDAVRGRGIGYRDRKKGTITAASDRPQGFG
ncbi:MAG: hypothetical protein AAF513_06985 [Pseudomonadota bacterium]